MHTSWKPGIDIMLEWISNKFWNTSTSKGDLPSFLRIITSSNLVFKVKYLSACSRSFKAILSCGIYKSSTLVIKWNRAKPPIRANVKNIPIHNVMNGCLDMQNPTASKNRARYRLSLWQNFNQCIKQQDISLKRMKQQNFNAMSSISILQVSREREVER